MLQVDMKIGNRLSSMASLTPLQSCVFFYFVGLLVVLLLVRQELCKILRNSVLVMVSHYGMSVRNHLQAGTEASCDKSHYSYMKV